MLRPILILAAALTLSVSYSMADTSIRFAVESTLESPNEDAEHDDYKLTVLLGKTRIEARTSTHIQIHDFKQETIYSKQDDSESYTRSSLYSDIGFRVYEFQNRLMLGGALSSAEIEKD